MIARLLAHYHTAPPFPLPGPIFGNVWPEASRSGWACMAYWGAYAAGGASRQRWLAPVKATWNVVLYRLTRPWLTMGYYERHGWLAPRWYRALWWD